MNLQMLYYELGDYEQMAAENQLNHKPTDYLEVQIGNLKSQIRELEEDSNDRYLGVLTHLELLTSPAVAQKADKWFRERYYFADARLYALSEELKNLCTHNKVYFASTGLRWFSNGEVMDDIDEKCICATCGKEVEDAKDLQDNEDCEF